MARVWTRFSRRSKYYISKHAFLVAYHYCLNYNDWKREHDANIGLKRGGGESESNGGVGDPTASQAIRLSELHDKISLIEQTAYEAEPTLEPYLLRYVTNEGMTFDKLKAQGIPCERKMFYDRRRKFYWMMSIKLKL